ncbi:sister chromatid cohesion protein PDS5 A [Carex littledalei]|uniref:Sister chromatid cohesion protein PDS5 A n=1 Tax=Carex littledalei TaxID=544730 RepID=A0A833VLY0_9POAL|nr:sister chromatid cohesion protein PDS5 A [Carex littledalei]
MSELTIEEVGRSLSQPRLSKDTLVKLLKQAESALSVLNQDPKLQSQLAPLCKSLSKNDLLHHKDKDVRLLIGVCCSEIMRVLAPEPPFSDTILKEIFRLFIGIFNDLGDTKSPYLPRRMKIIENAATLKCYVILLDIGCEDLVLELFKTFFFVLSQGHQNNVFYAMLSIMTQLLDEKISQPLVDVILRNLVREGKGKPYELASLVVKYFEDKLEPFIRSSLSSCLRSGNSSGKVLGKIHHRIILEVFRCSPRILFSVIPNLINELVSDHVDVRVEAVRLIGELVSLSKFRLGKDYPMIFVEFLERFSDESMQVRIAAVECVRSCIFSDPSGGEESIVLNAIEGRLLDAEDKVRIQAVSTVCELAKLSIQSFPSEVVLRATERLRDRKISVRKNVLHSLLDLYRFYCDECSKGIILISSCYEQIPCNVLLLCFDKDTDAFRPKNLELLFAQDLFPPSLSPEERASHWIAIYSLFIQPHIKAFSTILSQKKRLHSEMQTYLALRLQAKDHLSEEAQNKILSCFTKMSCHFPDASKAVELFHCLHRMKDKNIFKDLQDLCDESSTLVSAKSTRDSFLKRIGSKHQSNSFFKALSWKCSHSLLNCEIVQCIVEQLQTCIRNRETKAADSIFELLLAVSTTFPSFLKRSEVYLVDFIKLISDESNMTSDKCLLLLAKSCRHLSIKLSDIYQYLERKCHEGTRAEAKYAIAVISSLVQPLDKTFTILYKIVKDALFDGCNVPTVLQSLGHIARFSPSTYDKYEKEFVPFIRNKVIVSDELVPACEESSSYEDGFCSLSCKYKIYGVKALVKSYLPEKLTDARQQINEVFNILSGIILEEGIFKSIAISEYDKPYLREVAAKSILKLATRWDSYISPKLFCLTILRAKDPASTVRISFMKKLYILLKENKLPNKYACAFALVSMDSVGDIRNDAKRFMTEVLKKLGEKYLTSQRNLATEKEKLTNHPAYIVVYLVHVLAHLEDFPSDDSLDEGAYVEFSSPLIVLLKALLGSDILDGIENGVDSIALFLVGIFSAMLKAEDAVDNSSTPKLHKLAKIGFLATKALSKGCKMSSDSLVILLPSSYYKACKPESYAEEKNAYNNIIDGSFVKRILQAHEISTQAFSELVVKTQSSSGHSKAKTSRSSGSQNKPVDTGAPKTHSRKRTESSDRSDKNENNSQKDKVSSCGSGSANPVTVNSQCLTGTESVSVSRIENENPPVKKRNCMKTFQAGKENPNSSKDCREKLGSGEELVGRRIKVWDPFDMRYSYGTVRSFYSQNSCHEIVFDGGEKDLIILGDEKWEILEDTSALKDKDLSKFCPKDWPESSNSSGEAATQSNEDESGKQYSSSDEALIHLKKKKVPSGQKSSKKGIGITIKLTQ